MIKNKGFLDKKSSKITIFIVLDILSLLFSAIFALGLRFDFDIPKMYLINAYKFIIIDTIIMLLVYGLYRLYTSVWRYASISELIDVCAASLTSESIICLYRVLFDIKMPRSYFLIQVMLLFLLTGGLRYSYRLLRFISGHWNNKKETINTMIVGAGDACKLIIEEINNNPDFSNKVVCIIDDDTNKRGTHIRNIPIVGGRGKIEEYANKLEVKEIIIAIPSASKDTIREIVNEAQKTKCEIKILPAVSKMINRGDSLLNKVRPISYEDFLGRDQIVVNNEEIQDSIKDKVVLVTGGGGSIGSELCRQIANAKPKMLIIFDIYENNAYDIQQELFRNYPELDLHTIIGSVRDYDRVERVFKDFKPEIVFHAAAHKHVPLMEVSPNEAIKNNCLGTLNVAKLADIYKTKKFVLVSTDKCRKLLIEKILNRQKILVNTG